MSASTVRFFEYSHLPPSLRVVVEPIAKLAHELDASLADGPEKETGMRKLLEAKDCFVRAALPAHTMVVSK